MVDKLKEFDERIPMLKEDPTVDDRIPRIRKNTGTFPTSKGK